MDKISIKTKRSTKYIYQISEQTRIGFIYSTVLLRGLSAEDLIHELVISVTSEKYCTDAINHKNNKFVDQILTVIHGNTTC